MTEEVRGQQRDRRARGSAAHRWACPGCHAPLEGLRAGGSCPGCGRSTGEQDGFLDFVAHPEVQGTDRLMRAVYHNLAPLHDPLLAGTFRLLLGSRLSEARATILDRLGARPGERVLEVGTGTGQNALRLASAGVHYVGVDLAAGMLRIARSRLAAAGRSDVPLALADAHALPFQDDQFDRVMHVGAVNSFRDPERALSEMARVAKPGGMLLLVDEELAPEASRLTRIAFRAATFYASPAACRAPERLPGAVITSKEQLSDFFYLLRARVG